MRPPLEAASARAAPPALPAPAPEPGWELCDISYRVIRGRLFGSRGFRFKAWATGPDGSRALAESASFRTDPRQEADARMAFDELIAQLHAEGWEGTGERGSQWYNVRLRRPFALGPNGATEDKT